MKCPFPNCRKDGMIPPRFNAVVAYGWCPHCKRHSRATMKDGEPVKYSVAAKAPKPVRERVKSLGIKDSPAHMEMIHAFGFRTAQQFWNWARDMLKEKHGS